MSSRDIADRVALDSSAARRTGPVRTCVGCRRRAPKAELLRCVAVGSALVPDLRRREPGRGAAVHPDPGCLDLAERRGAFSRALRVQGPLDLTAVRRAVEEQPGRNSSCRAPEKAGREQR